jgi:hypothetical protein
MRPAEAEGFEFVIGVADEIAIGENRSSMMSQRKPLAAARASLGLAPAAVAVLDKTTSAILTYLGFNVTKPSSRTKY